MRRTTREHREVREQKGMALRGGSLDGNQRYGSVLCQGVPCAMAWFHLLYPFAPNTAIAEVDVYNSQPVYAQ